MTKITKLSLAALLALGTVANAAETNFSGDAKFWFETGTNNGAAATGFGKTENGTGTAILGLGMTHKADNGVTLVGKWHGTETFGIQNDVAASVRYPVSSTDAFGANDGQANLSPNWISEAYVTGAMGSTTFTMGRMPLDTPLAFTERWNATYNTFGAAVVSHNIGATTLIYAYVGSHNSMGTGDPTNVAAYDGFTSFTTTDTEFNKLSAHGAHMVAASTAAAGAKINAYYYNVPNGENATATALWADATINVAGTKLKVIGANVALSGTGKVIGNTSAIAANASMKVAGIKLYGAVSKTTKGDHTMGNIATTSKKTKLGTDGVYTDGRYGGQPDVMSIKVKAATKVAGITTIAQFVMANAGDNGGTRNDVKLDSNELDVILKKKVGNIDFKAIYMMRMGTAYNGTITAGADSGTATTTSIGGDADATTQQKIRVVASLKF